MTKSLSLVAVLSFLTPVLFSGANAAGLDPTKCPALATCYEKCTQQKQGVFECKQDCVTTVKYTGCGSTSKA
jgi:hypothetical protein